MKEFEMGEPIPDEVKPLGTLGIMEDSLDGVCKRCGCTQCANYVKNPYQWEIYEEVVMEWLCLECYSDISGDI